MFVKKKSFLNTLVNVMSLTARADQMATAVVNGGDNVKMDLAVRVVYAKDIEFKALPNMRFLQFATMKTELGVTPGLTIQMLTYDNLKLGTKLTEATKMTTQALSQSMKSITVYEYGNAVKVSELLLQSSFDDIMGSATTLLGRDYALVVDCALRDTALSGTNVIYARKKDGAKVALRSDLTNDCVLSVAVIKDGVEILSTNNAPKYNGESWICFVHPHQSRGLRDDNAWINASNYGDPTRHFTGEIGMVDDVKFIETTLMSNGACPNTDPAYKHELKVGVGTVANKTNVYQALLFGDNYYGMAVALPVEMRDNGVIDFGREHGIAWYSIFGCGLLHNENGVVIETA